MKKRIHSNTILILIFLLGLSLLLYPSVSDYWNTFTQSQAVSNYTEQVATLNNEIYDRLMEEARAYNQTILDRETYFEMSEEEMAAYHETLNITGTGIMGYVEIPEINCSLPIYHTVEETVLQTSVGHVEWSSLPVGGENTHAVISGHRGLPSAKLFSRLDRLTAGDTFMIQVLDETLTYEVDQILIVEPHETEDLKVIEGEDLCTLVTCTPYGVNTHRLLVRGHRVDNEIAAKVIRVTADAIQIDPVIMAPLVAAPMLLLLLLWLLVPIKKKR